MDFINQQKKKQRTKWIVLLCGIGAAFLLAVLLLTGVLGGGARSMTATKLRCTATQSVTPFGDRILYYDDMTLYCLNARGGEEWSYTIGSGAGFSCDVSHVVVWLDRQIYVLDKNGNATFISDRMADTVQFARISSKYVAVVLGTGTSPTLVVRDLQGESVDTESSAYSGLLLLDMGFFGNGDYLWTTALDAYGIVPNTVMNTFQVGKMNTGEVTLGEYITYAVIYSGTKLNVIDTRQLRLFDYRGTQDTSASMLVYGWQLIDSATGNSDAMMLFAPVRQTSDAGAITELRLLYGKTDKRYSLPDTCVGAALRQSKLYAFSANSLYRADISSQRFNALSLPLSGDCTDFLGLLSNGTALLCCNSEVYAVTLP